MSLTQEEQDKLDYLTQWVTARVDELMPNAQTPEAPVKYIDKELDKAALYVLRTVKKQLAYTAAKVSTGAALIGKVAIVGNSVVLECPEDYIRFLRLEVTGWKRPVDQLISVDSNRYRQQSNQFLAGDPHKPVAGLVPSSNKPHQAIQATPYNSAPIGEAELAEHQIARFFYVPRLRSYEMPEDLEDPMVWLAASRALSILRQPNLAQQAMVNMQQSMDQLLVGLHGEEMPSLVNSSGN